jgi:ligand-binding SRPBCC domain-containing protein
MQKGAFKQMKHTHEFQRAGEGTMMKDILEFQSPFGMVGIVFDSIVLKYYMKKFVKDRNHNLKLLLEL